MLVDTLMLAGLRWVLDAISQAVEAARDDDVALRAALLQASVRFEAGEIPEEEFARFEEEILARISEIRARREAGAGAIAFAGPAASGDGEGFEVEAGVAGDFHTR